MSERNSAMSFVADRAIGTKIAAGFAVVLLILAALNVLYFHKRVMHNVDEWDRHMPWRAKMVGILSLILWLGVVIAGRWTAYF